jgi:LysM repeat protein
MKYKEEQESQEQKSNTLEQKVTQTPQKTQINKEQTQDSAIYHIIQKGDTFYNLAGKYWGEEKNEIEIEKLNPGVNPDKLKIGQKIRVK